MPNFRLACVAATLVLAGAASASPEKSATGVWNRDDGLGGVRIARCGAALCGHVVWLKDGTGPAYVGQRVLFDMRRTAADSCAGSAVNPTDGQTYSGTMTITGTRLLTRGCLLGGAICQSVWLSRAP